MSELLVILQWTMLAIVFIGAVLSIGAVLVARDIWIESGRWVRKYR